MVNDFLTLNFPFVSAGRTGSIDFSSIARSGDAGSRPGLGNESGRYADALAAGPGLRRSGTEQRSYHRGHQEIAVQHTTCHRRMHPAGSSLFWRHF